MKDVDGLKGLHGLRTMQSTKKRSIPRILSSAYVDLYMLQKEKERILKENEGLSMRKEIIRKRLKELDVEMNRLQEVKDRGEVVTSECGYTHENGIKKEWKRISLNY